jgi:deoxyribodipyrimidine photo-lyase
MSFELVWLKRDLRWLDHAPLAGASMQGPIRVVYIVEPGLWAQPDVSLQHFEFIAESLHDLHIELQRQSGAVEVHYGNAVEVFEQIWQEGAFPRIHSHQETGNSWTYKRDLAVAAWCQSKGVSWQESAQFGVVRGLKDRNRWQRAWEQHMGAPRSSPGPMRFWRSYPSHSLRMDTPAGLAHSAPKRQRGGRGQATLVLQEFLETRSEQYRGGISSPRLAPNACSRLSVYLAYGCLSMREVVQASRARLAELPAQSRQRLGLQSFLSRLYWHCHFIQKLESEPEIEWQNMHRGYDGLREEDFNLRHFEALQAGATGWPMVDACVTMLGETGWLNFRMRAMLVSVASYPLWLHWRPVGEWLARQFLDYEPGIHWSQMQMQAGTTGINTTRVYNPIKQAQDHDPRGDFVRFWLPHLRGVPSTWIFEPWRLPAGAGLDISRRDARPIPQPVVDLAAATKLAKQRLYERRNRPDVRAAREAIVERHASRLGRRDELRESRAEPEAPQLSLDL